MTTFQYLIGTEKPKFFFHVVAGRAGKGTFAKAKQRYDAALVKAGYQIGHYEFESREMAEEFAASVRKTADPRIEISVERRATTWRVGF